MKKFFLALSLSLFLTFLSAPSIVKATEGTVVGSAIVKISNTLYSVDLYSQGDPSSLTGVSFVYSGVIYSGNYSYNFEVNNRTYNLMLSNGVYCYIPTLLQDTVLTSGSYTVYFYKNLQDYYDNIPEQFVPELPTWWDNMWDYLYDLYYDIFGFYPLPGSILDWLADPDNEGDVIVLPTNIPTPTPTPNPTPIPVQTIYVPDGNGGFTIIYQYPDENGNPTQSPINPNLDYEITVNCDCGGSDPDKDRNKQDPYYAPVDYFSWGSVDGDFSDSPAYTAGQSLDIIKATVSESDADMKVVSNSFGFLPPKWLTLVGLLGACLIVAGLIRTFLGG